MAALQHRVGLSAVQGGNVRPTGKADADREEDGQASTVVGRLEAILVPACVCFPDLADVAAMDGGQANAVLKRSHYLVTSGLH